ncbi:Abi family protein [Actinomyces urogenitalis]|uniref:Abi family protein n=1 Tax=Actinomyces urogenitalis TaxID=103621 RepID=UPI002431A969|nr:Abi family protein [Actinomyces urogenitalis]MCI7456465.1 Abi family protein [Actinomyces urogenitalis]
MGHMRQRGSGTYDKPPLSQQELVERMRGRGLLIPDDARALRYVRHIGYYRLSPYTIPFRVPGSDEFRPEVAFDDVLHLYVFDRELRLLVLDALERVEVAVRSSLTDHMSLGAGGPFWYENAEYVADADQQARFLESVDHMCQAQLRRPSERVDGSLVYQSALEHYLLTYGAPQRPPSWVLVEELTIGQLSRLFDNLAQTSDKTAIARPLGVTGTLLSSWLRSYIRVRNICAHHGRLWNRALGVAPKLPHSKDVRWLEYPTVVSGNSRRRERLYPVLASLQSILFTISPSSSWAARLSELLDRYPEVPLEPMGIPRDWKDDDFWCAAIDASAAASGGVGDEFEG